MEHYSLNVRQLSKVFQTFSRREGLLGGIKDLFHREYRPLVAVDAISFSVRPGELIGFIGPNGAGKSTTIKMLTGILRPTSGEIECLGFNPYRERKKYCQKIGVVFGQRTQLWWDIAVIESFRLLGKIYRVPQNEFEQRLAQLTDILELGSFLHTPVRKLSLGQRLRSDMAASLLHNPKLLFLDEPTIGVDAVAKRSIRAFLKQINKEFKTTILLTTHDLVEIEELCERIIIVDKGRIVYDGSLGRIRSLRGLRRRLAVDFTSEVSLGEFEKIVSPSTRLVQDGSKITAEYDPQELPTVNFIRAVVERFPVADLAVQEPEIEEILIKIYQEGLAEDDLAREARI